MTERPDLSGKIILITGASRGLGASLAEEMARAGAAVSICARSADELREVASRVEHAGGDCVWRVADVTDLTQTRDWVAATAEDLGEPNVLVNNASVLGPRTALADHPLDEWRRTLEINLTGALVATQAALPHLKRAGAGSIINVSSGAAIPPRREWGAYAVSKHALEGMTRNLAAELEGSGVRANAVDPGAMRTGMRAAAYPDEDPNTLKTPAEAAAVFLWLASDDAAGVTGQRFNADEYGRGVR